MDFDDFDDLNNIPYCSRINFSKVLKYTPVSISMFKDLSYAVVRKFIDYN
jgi:hypothetical protein